MAVNGKGKTPDNRTWGVKTPNGKRVEDKKGVPYAFTTFIEANTVARNHTRETGIFAQAVTV